MRTRFKDCHICKNSKDVLYRCKYHNLKIWVFLCEKCLNQLKSEFQDSYQYGGTWKSKKG